MNRNAFMSILIAHGETQKTLADAMGISLSRLNAKINAGDEADFTGSEIRFIMQRYELTPAEVSEIFFAQ